MTTPTIRGYLDAELPRFSRLAQLDRLLDAFAPLRLDDIVADLRDTLTVSRVSLEDARRLHILISRLHHDHHAELPLTRVLRAEVGAARGRVDHAQLQCDGRSDHVLLEP